MKNFRELLVLLFLGFIQISIALAQSPSDSIVENSEKFIYNKDHFAYTDLRYGYTKLGSNFHVGMNYKYRFNIFKIGFSHTDNFSKVIDNDNHLNDISFLYGWSFRKRNFLFSAAFGVGGIWGNAMTNKKRYDSIPFEPQIKVGTVGIPIELVFSFTPPPKIKTFSSIGVAVLGNLNNQKAYIGIGLNLAFGKVSPKLTEAEEKNIIKDYYVPKERRQKWYD
ncbi:MAG: hypothetical protein M9958_02450 [Chitinophagales bacterium]|nr:hypothetical protein [Chitinophagales bacterium]